MAKNNDLTAGYMRLLIEEVRKEKEFLLEEPELLHEASIAKQKHPFKALFVLGPAGSGKSFISGQIGIEAPMGFFTSNPDEPIEDVFPAFGITLKYATRECDPDLNKIQQTSRKIFQNAVRAKTLHVLGKGAPVIFDTTGEDRDCPPTAEGEKQNECDEDQKSLKLEPRIKALVKWGYDVGVLLINVPPSISISSGVTPGSIEPSLRSKSKPHGR